MASGTNAFPSRGGFNQSGGAHFICLTSLDTTWTNQLLTPGSNSGGAFVGPTLATASMTTILGPNAGSAAALVGANRLIKDMGRTVVSAGRVFRKFAPVFHGLSASTFGVVGPVGSASNAGYGAFYLEVGREGSAAANSSTGSPAPIVRYF